MPKGETVKATNKVVRRDEQTDWNGKKVIRLDCRGELHIYVPEGHQLAATKPGQWIKVSVVG